MHRKSLCRSFVCVCVPARLLVFLFSENQNPSPSVMALHAHHALMLPLPQHTHFSQARLVSFLTITMSRLLLAGGSTASVSFQWNCTTVKVKGTFLFQSPAGSDGEGWE